MFLDTVYICFWSYTGFSVLPLGMVLCSVRVLGGLLVRFFAGWPPCVGYYRSFS